VQTFEAEMLPLPRRRTSGVWPASISRYTQPSFFDPARFESFRLADEFALEDPGIPKTKIPAAAITERGYRSGESGGAGTNKFGVDQTA
jgi:hypothetical protein